MGHNFQFLHILLKKILTFVENMSFAIKRENYLNLLTLLRQFNQNIKQIEWLLKHGGLGAPPPPPSPPGREFF